MSSRRVPHIARHTARLVALAAAGAAALSLAPAADAAQPVTTTRYMTIDVAPATASSPALFLGATSTGAVTLQRYSSGEMRQQWTATYPTWPGAPVVTGHGPLDGITDCDFSGCGFTGQAGSTVKLVNRQYARCLTLTPTTNRGWRVTASRCAYTGPTVAKQTWATVYPRDSWGTALPDYRTALRHARDGGPSSCVRDATGKARDGSVLAGACSAARSGQFRFLPVAEATCRPRAYMGKCGLGAPMP